MKHLKVEGRLTPPDYTHVRMTVLESCVGIDTFGGNKEGGHLFFGSECCLVADRVICHFDSINSKDNLRDIFIGPPNSCCDIPIEHWETVKNAINEYNEWGGSLK